MAQDKDFFGTAVKVDSAASYSKSADRVVTMGKLLVLRDDAGLPDDGSYKEPLNANQEANSKYFNETIADAKGKITDLSKALEEYGKKDSKVKMKDLFAKLNALKEPMGSFKTFKEKGFQGLNKPSVGALTGENRDIEDNYFAAANLVNARYNFEQTRGLDDSDPEEKKKKTDAEKWLQGAELLQGMRSAKASTWESWNKIKDLPGADDLRADTHSAEKAWKLADSKSKIDFKAAKEAYLAAKAEYDKFYTEREPVAKAKEKTDQAFNKIPDKINVYIDLGQPYSFPLLAKTNGKLKAGYDEAGKLAATDPKKAEEKYKELEKKYNDTTAKISQIVAVANDVQALYNYQENLPDIKDRKVARSIQLDTLRTAMSGAYAAARDFAYDADPASADKQLGQSASAYKKVREDYYVTSGRVKLSDQPSAVPSPTPGNLASNNKPSDKT